MPIEFDENSIVKGLNKRIRLSVLAVSALFLFLFFRIGYLQILKGTKYHELSTNNRIRITKITAPRGRILAKDGTILVDNIPSFDLEVIPQDMPDRAVTTDILSGLLSVDRSGFIKKIEESKHLPPFKPVTLKKELAWEEMSRVLSRKMDLPGVAITVVPKRRYFLNGFASHVFGFLGEVGRQELRQNKEKPYTVGDMAGKYGLEKWGEPFLRGTKGGRQTEVDVLGNRQKVLAEVVPVKGSDIIVSIDPVLQKKAFSLLNSRAGSIVVMNIKTGDVLVLASSPAFDPNLFSRGIDKKSWQSLIDNPLHPLLNRAIQSQQPPGSLFKIVTAVAALEEGLVDPNETVYCPGHYTLGRRTFRCWKHSGHGAVTLRQAIVESCDVYFYTLGLKVGIDTIIRYARMMGLGEKTGIILDGERDGLLPTPAWKKKKYGFSWQKGETLNIAIGQGFLLTTPLQIASFFSGLANKGNIMVPRIVCAVKGEGRRLEFAVKQRKKYSLSPQTLSFIMEALQGVVSDEKGTGFLARTKGLQVGGKTGTAQVASKKNKPPDKKDIPWSLMDHAWFAAVAPVHKPEICVCVFIEHGGSGGSVAAPIAKELLDCYLHNKQEDLCLTED